MQWLFVDYQFYCTDLMPVPDNLDYWSYMTSVCTVLFKFSDSLLIFSRSSIYYWKGSTKVPKFHYYCYCPDLLLIVCVCVIIISPLNSVSFYFMYFGYLLSDEYVYNYYTFLMDDRLSWHYKMFFIFVLFLL